MILGLCLPTGDLVHMDFTLSLTSATIHTVLASKGDIEVRTYNPRASLVQIGRYIAVKSALEHGCDKLMWIDSDMVFPAEGISRLLAHKLPIVGATYLRRREPHTILGVADLPGDGSFISPTDTGLAKMRRIPTGFLLVDAEVFRKLPKPWFEPRWDPEAERWHSEDYMFCDRAREAGFDIWCDLDLSHEIMHCALHTVWWSRDPTQQVGDDEAAS